MADHLVGGLHCADATELAAAFVLGALEPADTAAVREHLAGCPEAHGEFDELGSVPPALLETVDVVQPPGDLGARIRAAAEAQQRAGARRRPAPAPMQPRTPVAIDIPRAGSPAAPWFRRPLWAAAGLAAALAVVVLGVWNLQLRDQIGDLSTYRNGVAAVLDQAAQPGAQLAVLKSSAGTGPSGIAAVGADGRVALVMHELTPTSGAQVYEAWLIGSAGAPVPIGGFTVGPGGSAWFATPHASLGDGVTVALTLEPGPGATTPTMPIIAAGKAA
ncbi:MAG TPA: anti-sigma factor [Candidatus Dormibacteraeota bacterium]|nr:anti-sigma factor [Candidatus Dormibacteraeota bacterium]